MIPSIPPRTHPISPPNPTPLTVSRSSGRGSDDMGPSASSAHLQVQTAQPMHQYQTDTRLAAALECSVCTASCWCACAVLSGVHGLQALTPSIALAPAGVCPSWMTGAAPALLSRACYPLHCEACWQKNWLRCALLLILGAEGAGMTPTALRPALQPAVAGGDAGDCCMGVSLLLSAHRHSTLQAVCLDEHAFVTLRASHLLFRRRARPGYK